MAHNRRSSGSSSPLPSYSAYNLGDQDALVSDGFSVQDLDDGADDPPPPYGELADQLQFSQPGFEAGANVTDDGRVNININQKNHRLSDILSQTLRNQVRPGVTTQTSRPPSIISPGHGVELAHLPNPKLNIVIQIVGSRGDVQPFVALGKVLKGAYGHRIRIATHPTFRSFVEDNGLEFFSIGGDPAELMAFMVKNPGLMPGMDAIKSREVTKRRKGIREILLGCWRSCVEPGDGTGPAMRPHGRDEAMDYEGQIALPGDPTNRPFIADAIIANPPSFAHIHIAEKLGIPLHMMFTMPWSPTKAFPHPLANIQSTNTDDVMTSYMSYALVEMMTWQGLGDVINGFRDKVLDLEPIPLLWAPGLLSRLQIPYTYCWSPALIPKPNDWASNIDISGFFFLDLATSYTPEPELQAFLDAGEPPVYIGFGSIVVDDPNALTRIIFDAIHIAGVRALVSKGWGGLGAEDVGVPEGIYMVGNCPHDWLFHRVSAVVHHGGAGTAAAGIRAGRPTVVVPFFGDQPFWGAMIARAGAGPNPVPYKDLTAENLAQSIIEALKPATADKARLLGEKIREENGVDLGGKSFHSHLDVESLRCSLAPSRVAVWRVRRTQVRLSTLAAAILVREGVIQYSDLKLWRPREYNTEGQPWDPVTAVASSLVTDIGDIALAIADFPRDVFQHAKREASSRTGSSQGVPTGRLSEQNKSSDTIGGASVTTIGSTSIAQEQGKHTGGLSSPSGTRPSSSYAMPGFTELPWESERGSAAALAPSVTVTSDGTKATPAGNEPDASEQSGSRSDAPRPSSSHQTSGSGSNAESMLDKVNLEDVRGAGTSVRKIVTTGVKSPMNFCLGLAKGFRNMPKLYNDDTVRPQEKVTGLTSGLKVAGKEFGLGFYDGVSGLVVQPWKGAEKEGGKGLIKGFGKGVSGLLVKPAAAIWSLPAYAMQGAYLEMRNLFAKSVQNHIITSRIVQGEQDLRAASDVDTAGIVAAWNRVQPDLKGLYALKQKGGKDGTERGRGSVGEEGRPTQPLGSSSLTNLLSPEYRKNLIGQAASDLRRQVRGKDPQERSPTRVSSRDGPAAQDEEFERAIRESVRETSRGNTDEDAAVEAAIRASVQEIQRTGGPLPEPQLHQPEVGRGREKGAAQPEEITDEEYQELIQRAIQQSMMMHVAQLEGTHSAGPEAGSAGAAPPPLPPRSPGRDIEEEEDDELKKVLERSKTDFGQSHGVDYGDEELEKVLQESRTMPIQPPGRGTAEEEEDEEEALRRAIEESVAVHQERADRDDQARTEDEKLMEYVKQQSLADEEGRRRGAKGKTAVEGDDDEEDEELKRALEMSLRMSSGGSGSGGGPSRYS